MADIKVERSAERVATVTLNRPAKMNALSATMFFELKAALEELEMDDAIGAIVLTGAGKGFCAGHDLNDVGTITDLPVNAGVSQIEKEIGCLTKVRSCGKPVIAAVNGTARGGGLSLATACAIRIASDDASFGNAFIDLDLCGADAGLSWTLPRLIGYGAATELMLTGRTIGAEEALRLGLVTDVTAPDKLLDRAHEIAEQIAAHHPLAVRLTQDAIDAAASIGFADAITLEARLQLMSLMTPEARARRAEFLNR